MSNLNNSFFKKIIKTFSIVGVALLLTAFLLTPLLATTNSTNHAQYIVAQQDIVPIPKNEVNQISQPLISPNPPSSSKPNQISNVLKDPSGHGGLHIVQYVETESGTPFVANGERITYTFYLTNELDDQGNGNTVNQIIVTNDIHEDALENIETDEFGIEQIKYQPIPSLRGGSVITLEQTDGVNWFFEYLDPGEWVQLKVSGQVKCKTDGSSFDNRAFVDSLDGGQPDSNIIVVTVTVRSASSGADVSDGPTWCSSDLGGNFDTDWGDFDADGDLDLALGSTLGTTVYRNDDGQLNFLWTKSNRYTLGLRWADFNNDGLLELVAVGSSANNNNATSPGINYIYYYDGTSFAEFGTFNSEFQLLRAIPGDYNSDGFLDLVVSSTALNVSYPVRLYINDGTGRFTGLGQFVSSEATADIGPADYDNDGDLDVALGLFQSKEIWIFNNDEGVLTETNMITRNTLVAEGISFPPYNFAWGDYNTDGFLDLAAALPLQREVRIFRNPLGSGSNDFELYAPKIIRTRSFLSPRVIDWGDFNGDGKINLVLVDSKPQIYGYNATTDRFSQDPNIQLKTTLNSSQIWSMRGMDYDNDGDLDISLGNQDRPMMLFTSFTPRLAQSITPIGNFNASSVAWGDANADGRLDLVFGAGKNLEDINLKLYNNDAGQFPIRQTIQSGFGPNTVAFADVDQNGRLDIAISAEGNRDRVYPLDKPTFSDEWRSPSVLKSTTLAWADADENSDHRPHLLIGIDGGPNTVYQNLSEPDVFTLTAIWQTPEHDNTTSVAWGNFNSYPAIFTTDVLTIEDGYIDFAVGNYGQPNRIYKNMGDGTFSLYWSELPDSDGDFSKTLDIAWGDYDNDGDLDLVVANDGEPTYLYENQPISATIPFTFTKVWTSEEKDMTTSVAWGDWDNDGDLDLAVGNAGAKDYVYANQGSSSGVPKFDLLWRSTEVYSTTDIAWGDKDNDGDLDLAISQNGNGTTGIYNNLSVTPAHLFNSFDPNTIPLYNNPSYISLKRPGTTHGAYFYSSSELLSGPPADENPVIVPYTLFDPDGHTGARNFHDPTVSDDGDPIVGVNYEYSLNGGGEWFKATPFTTTTPVVPNRLGRSDVFKWDAVADQAISDNALFRMCVFYQNWSGPTQRTSACAISFPFRVRGSSCNWPDGPLLEYINVPVIGKPIQFQGSVDVGSGSLEYNWDFGDGTPVVSGPQTVQHTYSKMGNYDVTMTVIGEACPIAKQVVATAMIRMFYKETYLPLIIKDTESQGLKNTELDSDMTKPTATFYVMSRNLPDFPTPVTKLNGSLDAKLGLTHLNWIPNPEHDNVIAYHIYRQSRSEKGQFLLIATTSADQTTYTDDSAACGYTYFVTAVNAIGESLPSLGSYNSPRCKAINN